MFIARIYIFIYTLRSASNKYWISCKEGTESKKTTGRRLFQKETRLCLRYAPLHKCLTDCSTNDTYGTEL
jgi:hypothetical protein